MLKYIYLIIAVSSLTSCSNHNQDVNLQKQIQADTTTKASTILFASPQVVDSSHIIIYPLIFEQTSSKSNYSSSSDGERSSYWNLIFYNIDNNTQHLLIDNKKIVIHSFNLNGRSSSSIDNWSEGINIYKNNIFYDVVSSDFNQNHDLDNEDPTYLYVSDKRGNNFRQLSPDNYNVISWEVVQGTYKVILQAQKDDNGDKKFDQNDAIIPLIVDVSTGRVAKETFNQTYLDSLKTILSNTWKKT